MTLHQKKKTEKDYETAKYEDNDEVITSTLDIMIMRFLYFHIFFGISQCQQIWFMMIVIQQETDITCTPYNIITHRRRIIANTIFFFIASLGFKHL